MSFKALEDSIRACSRLRDDILTQWHKLGLEVTDDNLAEEAKRRPAFTLRAYFGPIFHRFSS